MSVLLFFLIVFAQSHEKSSEISGSTPPEEPVSDSVLTVISMDSTYIADGIPHHYLVQGVCMTIGSETTDTLFWIAPLPADIVPSLIDAGATEERMLELLVSGSTWVSGLMKVKLIKNPERVSLFRAYRTWLYDGTVLNLEAIIQTDSVFHELVRENLDIPPDVSTDSWLWTNGFWFDPESFILLLKEPENPVIRIGLPSVEGLDSLLIVDLPLLRLNRASMYD